MNVAYWTFILNKLIYADLFAETNMRLLVGSCWEREREKGRERERDRQREREREVGGEEEIERQEVESNSYSSILFLFRIKSSDHLRTKNSLEIHYISSRTLVWKCYLRVCSEREREIAGLILFFLRIKSSAHLRSKLTFEIEFTLVRLHIGLRVLSESCCLFVCVCACACVRACEGWSTKTETAVVL